jgi:hypothetical protein
LEESAASAVRVRLRGRATGRAAALIICDTCLAPRFAEDTTLEAVLALSRVFAMMAEDGDQTLEGVLSTLCRDGQTDLPIRRNTYVWEMCAIPRTSRITGADRDGADD